MGAQAIRNYVFVSAFILAVSGCKYLSWIGKRKGGENAKPPVEINKPAPGHAVTAPERMPAIIEADVLDAKIRVLWNREKTVLKDEIDTRTKQGDIEVLYQTELAVHNLLEYARQRKDFELIRELIDMNLPALDSMRSINGKMQWICGPACGPRLNGKEYILASSQYLYLHGSLLNSLLDQPSGDLNSADLRYAEKIGTILTDHYERWIYGPSVYPSWWIDCAPNRLFNYSQKLDWKLTPPYTGGGLFYDYCKIVHDVEMLIVGGAIELISASHKLPRVVILSTDQVSRFRLYAVKFSKLLSARLTATRIKDWKGESQTGIVLDPGYFRNHPDWSFAGYSGSKFPEPSDEKIVNNVSWDISHYRRIVHLFTSYRRHQEILDITFPSKKMFTNQINQFAYKVYDKSQTTPLFRTYTDGANGWFRVNYEGEAGAGYKPYGLSFTIANGGYGFWAADHADWRRVMESLYLYLELNKEAPERKKYYWDMTHTWEDLMYYPTLLPLTDSFPVSEKN